MAIGIRIKIHGVTAELFDKLNAVVDPDAKSSGRGSSSTPPGPWTAAGACSTSGSRAPTSTASRQSASGLRWQPSARPASRTFTSSPCTSTSRADRQALRSARVCDITHLGTAALRASSNLGRPPLHPVPPRGPLRRASCACAGGAATRRSCASSAPACRTIQPMPSRISESSRNIPRNPQRAQAAPIRSNPMTPMTAHAIAPPMISSQNFPPRSFSSLTQAMIVR